MHDVKPERAEYRGALLKSALHATAATAAGQTLYNQLLPTEKLNYSMAQTALASQQRVVFYFINFRSIAVFLTPNGNVWIQQTNGAPDALSNRASNHRRRLRSLSLFSLGRFVLSLHYR